MVDNLDSEKKLAAVIKVQRVFRGLLGRQDVRRVRSTYPQLIMLNIQTPTELNPLDSNNFLPNVYVTGRAYDTSAFDSSLVDSPASQKADSSEVAKRTFTTSLFKSPPLDLSGMRQTTAFVSSPRRLDYVTLTFTDQSSVGMDDFLGQVRVINFNWLLP